MSIKFRILKLEILESAAGFYIGRNCIENGEIQPYSRESGYFGTREAAESALINNEYFR